MWKYKRKHIKSIEDFPEGTYGFVYKITNLTNGKIYIGKKNLFTMRKRKFGKRELAKMKDKRGRKWEMVKKESNWLTYTGSNDKLNEDMHLGHRVDRRILALARNKAHLTYLEAKWQMVEGVLEIDSYNDSVLGKFFRKIFE